MAKYKRRPKVKRYRRSFYSLGMRIRKIVGIVVLVAVVLAAAWFAAPHVLDWATHTWYTVVKDRDLEAESASRAAASSQAAASAAAIFLSTFGSIQVTVSSPGSFRAMRALILMPISVNIPSCSVRMFHAGSFSCRSKVFQVIS